MADGETKLKELKHNQLDLSETVEKLESRFKHAFDGIKAQIARVEESLRKEIGTLRVTNEKLPLKITILEKAMANSRSRSGEVPRLWIPKPKHLNPAWS